MLVVFMQQIILRRHVFIAFLPNLPIEILYQPKKKHNDLYCISNEFPHLFFSLKCL